MPTRPFTSWGSAVCVGLHGPAGGRVPHGAVGALQRRSPFVLVTGGGDPGERFEAPRDAAALVQALDLREGVALGSFSASEVAL